MDIQKAQNLKIGQRVRCPADRGEPAHNGTVEYVGQQTATTHAGTLYVWVTVRRSDAHASVWPSNRLGN